MNVEEPEIMREEDEEEDDGDIEIAGGQPEADGTGPEESRHELDKLDKRTRERKNFLEQLQAQNKATDKSQDDVMLFADNR